jgi:hypothetical protein
MPFDEGQALKRIVKQVIRDDQTPEHPEAINQPATFQDVVSMPSVLKAQVRELERILADFKQTR